MWREKKEGRRKGALGVSMQLVAEWLCLCVWMLFPAGSWEEEGSRIVWHKGQNWEDEGKGSEGMCIC